LINNHTTDTIKQVVMNGTNRPTNNVTEVKTQRTESPMSKSRPGPLIIIILFSVCQRQ